VVSEFLSQTVSARAAGSQVDTNHLGAGSAYRTSRAQLGASGQERNEGPFQVKGERPRNQELRSGFGYSNAASHSFTQAFCVKHASNTCRFACT
jgi:hypothetical protein